MTDSFPNCEFHVLDERHRFCSCRIQGEQRPDAARPAIFAWSRNPDEASRSSVAMLFKVPPRLLAKLGDSGCSRASRSRIARARSNDASASARSFRTTLARPRTV